MREGLRGHFTYEVMIWYLSVKDMVLLHLGKNITGIGNSKCKVSEAGESLV